MRYARSWSALLTTVAVLGSLFAPFTASAAEIGGYIDGIDTSNSLVSNSVFGWAYDPRNPDAAVYVEVDVDGVLAGTVVPSLYRADVAAAFGISSYHGFRFPLPNAYFDGIKHTVTAYSVNSSTGGKTALGGSPFSFTRFDPGVTGYIDRVTLETPQLPTTYVHGWAFDNADHGRSVPIVAFVGDYTGTMIGAGLANVARTDVNTAYGVGDYHGFTVPIDVSAYSSGTVLSISVYAIDRSLGELKFIGTIAYAIP